MYSLWGRRKFNRFVAVLSAVVVVPRPRPRTGEPSHSDRRVFHLYRRVSSVLVVSPRSPAAKLVEDSLETRCAPRGVAKNARTTTPAITVGQHLEDVEPGRSTPSVVYIATRVIRPSMLNVATKAAENSAISTHHSGADQSRDTATETRWRRLRRTSRRYWDVRKCRSPGHCAQRPCQCVSRVDRGPGSLEESLTN